MTYRASLGTRGELRRIAAEAETATIDRVRPWERRIQPCRLAPHVIVPQWTRLERPVTPKPPPPLVSEARIVASETIEEVLESACAKKFRRGRGRRGRPRRRVEEPDAGVEANAAAVAPGEDSVAEVRAAGAAAVPETDAAVENGVAMETDAPAEAAVGMNTDDAAETRVVPDVQKAIDASAPTGETGPEGAPQATSSEKEAVATVSEPENAEEKEKAEPKVIPGESELGDDTEPAQRETAVQAEDVAITAPKETDMAAMEGNRPSKGSVIDGNVAMDMGTSTLNVRVPTEAPASAMPPAPAEVAMHVPDSVDAKDKASAEAEEVAKADEPIKSEELVKSEEGPAPVVLETPVQAEAQAISAAESNAEAGGDTEGIATQDAKTVPEGDGADNQNADEDVMMTEKAEGKEDVEMGDATKPDGAGSS